MVPFLLIATFEHVEAGVSIGESLAEARRQAGLTIGQVSQQTRIRESIIRDIEQNDFSACGGDFYARGHIRSIAAVVGTDPVPLISAYDAEHGPPGTRAADVFEPSTPIKIRERRSPSLSLIVGVVLLAIIGFGAYRLVSHDGGGAKPVAAPTHKATASAKPTAHPSPTPTSSMRTSTSLSRALFCGKYATLIPPFTRAEHASNPSALAANTARPNAWVKLSKPCSCTLRQSSRRNSSSVASLGTHPSTLS